MSDEYQTRQFFEFIEHSIVPEILVVYSNLKKDTRLKTCRSIEKPVQDVVINGDVYELSLKLNLKKSIFC